MLRIILYLATNFAVLALLGIVMALLGVHPQQSSGMLLMAAVFGMGGSFISLAMSKSMAKRSVGAQVIEQPRNETERWLLATVQRLSDGAGMGMPEVAVYDSPDMNAFATGMNKNSALVAVSTGLLRAMNKDEVEAVLGHEVSHVANGDMVTLSLIQGVVNTFVIFFSRFIASLLSRSLSQGSGRGGLGYVGYMAVSSVLQMVLGGLATVIVMWFSRRREFAADSGAAKLCDRRKMIAALRRLQGNNEPSRLPEQMAAFGIRPRIGGLDNLFRSHPPLEERIAALERLG